MSERPRGLFVVFEGIDGAGTTTQCRLLSERLRADRRRRQVAVTAEPSTGPAGTLIRHVLRERVVASTPLGERKPFDRRALALLFAADRLDHVSCEVTPLVEDGWVVISDRYVLSSLAYQRLDAPVDWVATINRFAPAPDILFFLDVDPEVAWKRIRDSRPGRDIFETPETLADVARAYRDAIPLCCSSRLKMIDGGLPPEDVAAQVWAALKPLLTAQGS
jgi:dTMP kinase